MEEPRGCLAGWPSSNLDKQRGGAGGSGRIVNNNRTNGTPTGTTVADGFYGKGRSFNGSGDYVGVDNFPNLSSHTAEFWIKTTQTTDARPLVLGSYNGNNETIGFLINYGASNGKILYWNAFTDTTETHADSTSAINDGNWHHIVGTWDGTSQKICRWDTSGNK